MRMSTTVPEQAMDALAIANAVRHEKAAIHHELGALQRLAGEKRAAFYLLQQPDCLRNEPLRRFLGWINGWGDQKVERFLNGWGVGQRRDVRVGQLTVRLRVLLAEALEGERRDT